MAVKLPLDSNIQNLIKFLTNKCNQTDLALQHIASTQMQCIRDDVDNDIGNHLAP